MNKLKSLDPIQYLRGRVWLDVIVPLIKTNPRVRAELSKIGANYYDSIESILEPDLSPEDLMEEMELRAHEFRVRCKEFHWLRSHIDGFDLVCFSRVLAEEIFPDKTWRIIEKGEDAVVVDSDRSMVFDIHNCDNLSALGALALCGDREANQNPKAVAEVNCLLDARVAELERVSALMRRVLDRFKNDGEILKFPMDCGNHDKASMTPTPIKPPPP